MTCWPAPNEDKSGMYIPRYPNSGQDCGSAKHGTIRMASFDPNIKLFVFDKIEFYTSNSSFFILYVISHVTTALCNLTGFCNWFWVTDHTVEIQGNPLITVTFKFIFQWFTQGFLFCTWYIFRKLTSFLWKIMILESTLSAVEKTISLLYLFILGNLPVYCHGRNAAWMIDSKV